MFTFRSRLAKIIASHSQVYTENIFCPNIRYLKNIRILILHTSNILLNEHLEYIQTVHTLILPRNTKLTDMGLKWLTNIKILNLSANKNISDVGISYIPNVEELYTNSKVITDGGLALLNNINRLSFVWNKEVTMNGLKMLGNVQYVTMKFSTMLKIYGSETNFKLISTNENCDECTKIDCKCFDFDKPKVSSTQGLGSSLSNYIIEINPQDNIVRRLQKLLERE
jgi:hypothetical protein